MNRQQPSVDGQPDVREERDDDSDSDPVLVTLLAAQSQVVAMDFNNPDAMIAVLDSATTLCVSS